MNTITPMVSGLISILPNIPYWKRDRSPIVSSTSWATPTAWVTARSTRWTATPLVLYAESRLFLRMAIPARQTALQMTRHDRLQQTPCDSGCLRKARAHNGISPTEGITPILSAQSPATKACSTGQTSCYKWRETSSSSLTAFHSRPHPWNLRFRAIIL